MSRKSRIRPRSKRNKGEADIYELIWNSRPHQCEVCERPIESPVPANFSHLLPKGSYSRFKRDERNIRIQCQRCHDLWHEHGPKILQYSTSWIVTCSRYIALRDEYNGVSNDPNEPYTSSGS